VGFDYVANAEGVDVGGEATGEAAGSTFTAELRLGYVVSRKTTLGRVHPSQTRLTLEVAYVSIGSQS